MDRNKVLRIYKSSVFGGLTRGDISTVLVQYCIEKGKPYLETIRFVAALLRGNSQSVVFAFEEAIEYYKKKFASEVQDISRTVDSWDNQ